MNAEWLHSMYWNASYDIDAPHYTMDAQSLARSKSEAENFRAGSDDELWMKAKVVGWLEKLIDIRSERWPTLFDEVRAITTLASADRLRKPSMAFAMGAGKAVRWNRSRLFKAAAISRFHYDIAVNECAGILSLAAEHEEFAADKETLAFASDILSGRIERPQQRGPQKLQTYGRDETISKLIELSAANGLNIYRNEATPHEESACDLVAALCADAECGVATYDAVKKIYRMRRRRRAEFHRNLYPCMAGD